MSNLLDKASIILTPTAYNNGEALCVKPSDGSGDFDFSRNSAATRVNAQGLVENVQILSSNLVQNGDFSEEGVQEVSNGSFSQEGVEEITNGDFTNNIDGWVSYASVSTWDNGTIKTTATSNTAWIRQNGVTTANKYYKVTFKAKASNISQNIKIYNGTFADTGLSFDAVDVYQEFTYYLYTTVTNIILGQQGVSVGDTINFDNVSCVEVGQDWTFGTGWSVGENKAVFDGGSDSNLSSASSVTNGKSYKYSFTVSDMNNGALSFRLGSSSSNDLRVTSNGSYSGQAVSDGTVIRFRAESGFNGSVTNISVKEVGQNWTLGTGWEIGNDVANAVNAPFGSQLVDSATLTASKKYSVSFVISNYIQGSVRVAVGNVFSSDVSADGNYTFILTSANTNAFKVQARGGGSGTTLSITNISVIQISSDTNLPRINYEGFSYQDALGSEEVVNGGFDTDTAWIKGTTWSIGGGFASATENDGSYLYQTNICEIGKKYKFTFDVTESSGVQQCVSLFNIWFDTSALAVGSYSIIHTAVNTSGIRFRCKTGGTGSFAIDNVSVKEYLGQEVVPDSGCGSWLFEPQSTNLVTDSEDYSQWTPTGVSVTSNSTTSPDGLINGTLLSTNGGTSSRLLRNYGLPTSATAKVLSIYAKANLSNFIQLLLSGDAQSYVNFDVSNGVVGTSGTKTTGEIQSVGNGWYRCIAYFDSTTIFGASSFVALTKSNSAGYGGGATSDELNVYIWGSQYEEQSYATSYIPTSGSTVTRNQDVCTNGGSLASINSTEGVLYAEIAALANSGTYRSVSLSNGTNANRVNLTYSTASNLLLGFINVNGVNTSFTFTVNPITDFVKCALKYKNNDCSLWVNGVEISNSTSQIAFPINTLTKLSFTSGSSSSNFFGKTKAVAVWKEALSDSELQSLTTI